MLDISHFVLSVISSSEALPLEMRNCPLKKRYVRGGGISQECTTLFLQMIVIIMLKRELKEHI